VEKTPENKMFSVREKRWIAEEIQRILKSINHPELYGLEEISFELFVHGNNPMSFADILNNKAIDNPDVNPWNEAQDNGQELKPGG
jgi:hypothetical protein